MADLIAQGLADLRARHSDTIAALLVAIGAPRLRRTGIDVPPPPSRPWSPELALYRALAAGSGDDALSQYSALIRRLVSFERARELETAAAARSTTRWALQGQAPILAAPPDPSPLRPSPAGGRIHDAAGDNFVVVKTDDSATLFI